MDDPVLQVLTTAEEALTPLVLAMREKGDLNEADETAIALMLEETSHGDSMAAMIGFIWALIVRVKEEWTDG